MRALESERDFYFSKLRDIELVCQDNEDSLLVKPILEIMYATQVCDSVCVCVCVCACVKEGGRERDRSCVLILFSCRRRDLRTRKMKVL